MLNGGQLQKRLAVIRADLLHEPVEIHMGHCTHRLLGPFQVKDAVKHFTSGQGDQALHQIGRLGRAGNFSPAFSFRAHLDHSRLFSLFHAMTMH